MDQIAVSIICNTYNQEKYIAQCLDSLIMQKTNFPFEVLVHDDASTDQTKEIIYQYQDRFPNIILPYFQNENQYSKGIGITETYQIPRARGNYFAICEGDDYWTDLLKLQKQFDVMEKHPEADMCAHAAEIIKDDVIIGLISPSSEKCIFHTDAVVSGGGSMFATNSLFYRRSMREKKPRFAEVMMFDYVLQIWGSLRDGIIYLPEKMSAYRRQAEGSWTTQMKKDSDQYVNHLDRVIRMLELLEVDLDPKYIEAVNKKKLQEKIKVNMLKGDIKAIRRDQECRQLLSSYPLKEQIETYLRCIKHFFV